MDHRRYWFKEQLVIMVLAHNKGLLVNLPPLPHKQLVEDDFLGSPSSLLYPTNHLLTIQSADGKNG